MSRNIVWILSEGRKSQSLDSEICLNYPVLQIALIMQHMSSKAPIWLYFHELDPDLLTIIYWQCWTNCSLFPHISKRCLGVKCPCLPSPCPPWGWLCFLPWCLSSCRRSAKRSQFHAPFSAPLFLTFWLREVVWPLLLPCPLRLIWDCALTVWIGGEN